LVPLPDFLGAAGLGLLGLLGAPRGLPLTACVLRCCHVITSVSPNAIVTRGSPAQSRRAEIGTNSRYPRGVKLGPYGTSDRPARALVGWAGYSWPVRAATSSAALRHRSSSSP